MWPEYNETSKEDAKKLINKLDNQIEKINKIMASFDTMQIKMLKDYKGYEYGETYEVPESIGRVILRGLYGYRVD